MEKDLDSIININKEAYIFIVAGLLYGDEGKGTTVEYLYDKVNFKNSKSNLVVRYCGGPQAAHHIVLKDKTFHCFSSFCSSSFDKNSFTLISKYVLVSPINLKSEYDILLKKGVNVKDRLYIDEECYVITPYHKLLNRVMETCLTLKECFGSTGQGVGVTMEDIYYSDSNFFPGKCDSKSENENDEYLKHYSSNDDTYFSFLRQNNETLTLLTIKDISNEDVLSKKIRMIKAEKLKQIKLYTTKYSVMKDHINKLVISTLKANPEEKIIEFYYNFAMEFSHCFTSSLDIIHKHLKNGKNIIFEGAQGMLLDRNFGFSPHITKSTCTDINVKALLQQISTKYSYDVIHKIVKIGVLRSYSSRHGNGPFVSFNNQLDIKEPHNSYGNWQGEFKIGDLDILALKYGVNIFKPDYLSVTWLDVIDKLYSLNNDKPSLKYIDRYILDFSKYNDSKDSMKLQGLIDHCIDNKLVKADSLEGKIIISEINPNKIDIFNNLSLTNLIKKSEPIYKISELMEDSNISNSIDNHMTSHFISFLERVLDKKVLIRSFGPTKEDKVINADIFI